MSIKNNGSHFWGVDIPDSKLPGYSFEKVEVEWWFEFMHWAPWFPPLVTVVYGALCLSLHTYMKKRQPKKVEAFYAVWCAFWAIFSFCVIVRWIGDWAYAWKVTQSSLQATYSLFCMQKYVSLRLSFWVFWFSWSKVIQAGDSFFMILLKKKLTIFHFAHHTSVGICVAVGLYYPLPWYRYFILFNSINLVFYYSFLTLKTLKVRPPSGFKKFLVTFEVGHMAVSPFMHYLATYLNSTEHKCITNSTSIPLFIVAGCILSAIFFFTFLKSPWATRRRKERVN